MSSIFDRKITITLNINSEQSQLLAGLDMWLKLGLISQTQVKQLCQQYLSSPLPDLVAISSDRSSVPPHPLVNQDQSESISESLTDPVLVNPQVKPVLPSNFITKSLQSLMAEISVRWLLFLGVFMVIVSSGVLVVSHWEKFPPVGQYGVLLGYTLTFWIVSFWTIPQQNLRLTAQTLQLVTLGLIPVNFWAIDSFQLWHNPLEYFTAIGAGITLTGATIFLIQFQLNISGWNLFNILGLSYLHWGWQLSLFPLVAIYVGTLETAIAIFSQYRNPKTPHVNNNFQTIAIIIYSLILLILRGIFGAHIQITQLGLALGISGWLLCWLSQQNRAVNSSKKNSTWELMGGILLGLGWLISVSTEPGQAIAISGLGLWVFASRLFRFWQHLDFLAICVIGLQTIWLGWRLIPFELQTWMIAISTAVTDTEKTPFALLSIALFPYLILLLWGRDWLYRHEHDQLAKFAEKIALLLGSFFTMISLVSPILRSLNLGFSTITTAVITKRNLDWENQRQNSSDFTVNMPTFLIYLTHLIALLTIASTIDWMGKLNIATWAVIWLTIMVGEWIIVALNNNSSSSNLSINHLFIATISRSSWYIGLGLAGLSYWLLYQNYQKSLLNPLINRPEWGILWLIVPLVLIGVASRTEVVQRQLVCRISIIAIAMAQLLTWGIPGGRLIGLGIATCLMLANTSYLQEKFSATITVGFGLVFVGIMLWEGVPGLPELSLVGWLVAIAIIINVLWLIWGLIIRHSTRLATIYSTAINEWAIAISTCELIFLTLHSWTVYERITPTSISILIASSLTVIAITYRLFRQPNIWLIYGLSWSIEILTAETLGFFDPSRLNLAIANFAIGLITQIMGDWLHRHTQREFPRSWHIIPLVYGILGAILRWGMVTNWTGLTSLSLALIAIGVGRRNSAFKPLVYLATIGISISAYEILFYHLSPISEISIGDNLIAMAALGVSIMYSYRILTPWLVNYLTLSAQELKIFAHLHWIWSSCLLMSTVFYPLGANKFLGLGIGIFLIRYAIFQGHRANWDLEELPESGLQSTFRGRDRISIAEIWVYLGLLEIAGLRLYWLSTPIELLFSDSLLPWSAAIAVIFAYFMYFLPWENWGWSKRPFLVGALICPLVIIWETKTVIAPLTLLIVAAFYILLAKIEQQIRVTYLSAILINWAIRAIMLWLGTWGLTNYLWSCTPPALTLLYLVQIEPNLQQSTKKEVRHILRLLGIGIIDFVALSTQTWFFSGILSIVTLLTGLALRTRAFLYIGTITFLLNVLNQLVILNSYYSFLKWLIGLTLGIIFIWIAANFETRREQIVSLVRNWLNELTLWE